MGDKNEIRVKFEIGEIKFEAEGSADLVERERSIFNNTLLPAAIEAIVRTRGMVQSTAYLGTSEPKQPMLSTSSDLLPENTDLPSGPDLSRSTLASFIKDYGSLSEQDFVLFSAYFDETKNKTKAGAKNGSENTAKTQSALKIDESKKQEIRKIAFDSKNLGDFHNGLVKKYGADAANKLYKALKQKAKEYLNKRAAKAKV